MQELKVKVTQAQVEIVEREIFEQNINEVVSKYSNYTVTAGTIKEDKQVLVELRKLKKQISDERIRIKKELSQSADEFDTYIKTTGKPLDETIDKIASEVKEFEEYQKSIRMDTVKSYIANKSSEYMLDSRIFDEKALDYIKAGDFMADGMTLKKATMKSLDDLVTFEFQKQQENEKSKATISGQCAEYNMNDQPYIAMLKNMTLVDVLETIKSHYNYQKQKEEMRRAEEQAEREREQILASKRVKEQEQAQNHQDLPQINTETGEILGSGQLSQNNQDTLIDNDNEQRSYTQKMTLEVYFTDTEEKDYFKSTLEKVGFEYKKNYKVSGYQRIEPLTQKKLNEINGWI